MRWKVVLVDPRETISGPNLRVRSDAHIRNLAKSMGSEVGQIQDCVGDTIGGKIRIWAGLHRRAAGLLLRRQGRDFRLRVRLWPEPLSPDSVLAIQLAENLHHEMSAAEEAEAIEKLYLLYVQLRGEEISITRLARLIGRGRTKVANALRFMTLESRVRRMVKKGLLTYSNAVEMASLSKEKQFSAATHIVLANLDTTKARLYLRRLVAEDQGILLPLFTGEAAECLDRESFRLAFRTAADRAAKDAGGYFSRVLFFLRHLVPKEKRAILTGAVKDILAQYLEVAASFRIELAEVSPSLAAELSPKVGRSAKPRTKVVRE